MIFNGASISSLCWNLDAFLRNAAWRYQYSLVSPCDEALGFLHSCARHDVWAILEARYSLFARVSSLQEKRGVGAMKRRMACNYYIGRFAFLPDLWWVRVGERAGGLERVGTDLAASGRQLLAESRGEEGVRAKAWRRLVGEWQLQGRLISANVSQFFSSF